MSIRNMVIMVLICLGLGTFWYIYDYKGEPERQEAKTKEERLFPDLKAEDVTDMHWTEPAVGKDSDRHLILKEGLWMLQDGTKQVLASQQETADTAKQVAELTRMSVIKETPQKAEYADFGLEKPEAELVLTCEGQPAPQTLLVGAETPAGDARYMQVKGKPAILEVAGEFIDFLRRRPVDMREKSLLAVSPERVSKIHVEYKDQEKIVLTKSKESTVTKEGVEPTTAGAAWQMESPQKCKADLDAVNDFLWQLHSCTISQFIPPVKEEELRANLANLEISVEGGPTMHMEFWDDDLGHKNDGSIVLHRLDTDEYMLFQPPAEREKVIGVPADNFVDRHLVSCRVDDIDHLVVGIPQRTVEGKTEPAQKLDASRDGEGWKISMPATTITDANSRDAAVFEVAYSVTDLQWKTRDKQGGGKVDTECPTIIAYDSDGKVIARFSVGAKGEKGYPVMMEGRSELYWLEADPSLEWCRSISALIPKEMAPKTPAASAKTPAAEDSAPGASAPAPAASAPEAAASGAPVAAEAPAPAAGAN